MIAIVNKRTHKPTPLDVPIHRGTPLGNPYDWRGSLLAKFKVRNREEALAAYTCWFDEQILKKNEEVLAPLRKIYMMALLGDVNLVCYCAPDKCHGETIKNFIEKWTHNSNSKH